MSTYYIQSVNVGKPQQMNQNGMQYVSGINKEAVSDTLSLSCVNLAGDGQADLKNHGGKDKAVCVYPYDHYAYWEKKLSQTIIYAAFGENITVKGLTEDKVNIGDIFSWGDATLQVSQPRMPCYKVGMKFNEKNMPKYMIETGFTGFYMRVLKEGNVSQRAPLKRIERSKEGISIAEVNHAQYHDTEELEKLRELLKMEELAAGWKKMVGKRLKELITTENDA